MNDLFQSRVKIIFMGRKQRLERFTEFLVIGVALGVIEDMIAIMLITGESFDLQMLGIVIMVAVPFAAFSELIVDSDEYKITESIAGKIKDVI